MPVISMFFGIIIRMNFSDHNPPHIHVEYQGYTATYLLDGELHEGALPTRQHRLVVAWIELHKEDLESNWKLAKERQPIFRIDPLR